MTAARRPVPPPVRNAARDEDHRVAEMLARSFADDPVMTWMIPNARRRHARLVSFYRVELRAAHRRGTVLTVDGQAGASLWFPPRQWRTERADVLGSAPALLVAFGRRIPAALKLLERMEAVHPEADHWYLGILGTDPARQGCGIGGALITEITDRCDETGEGAYLESSKESNVAYYTRFGFTVTDVIEAPKGPRLWGMWRDPR
jgi:GNAT superfamily N-acetyltransferase